MMHIDFDWEVKQSASRLKHLGEEKWREFELKRIGNYPHTLTHTPETHKIVLEYQSGFWVACFDDWSGAEDDKRPIAFAPTQDDAVVELLFAANINGDLPFERIVK